MRLNNVLWRVYYWFFTDRFGDMGFGEMINLTFKDYVSFRKKHRVKRWFG